MVLFWCVSALYLRGFYARAEDFVEISGSTLDLGPSCAGPRLRVDVCLLVLYMLLDCWAYAKKPYAELPHFIWTGLGGHRPSRCCHRWIK